MLILKVMYFFLIGNVDWEINILYCIVYFCNWFLCIYIKVVGWFFLYDCMFVILENVVIIGKIIVGGVRYCISYLIIELLFDLYICICILIICKF